MNLPEILNKKKATKGVLLNPSLRGLDWFYILFKYFVRKTGFCQSIGYFHITAKGCGQQFFSNLFPRVSSAIIIWQKKRCHFF